MKKLVVFLFVVFLVSEVFAASGIISTIHALDSSAMNTSKVGRKGNTSWLYVGHFFWSNDNGATWEQPIYFTSGSPVDSFVDSSNRLWVLSDINLSYCSLDSNCADLSNWSDMGGDLNDADIADRTATSNLDQNSSGALMFVSYHSGNNLWLWECSSNCDVNTNWFGYPIVADGNVNTACYPTIAVDSQDKVWVTYGNLTGKTRSYVTRTSGGSFSAPIEIDAKCEEVAAHYDDLPAAFVLDDDLNPHMIIPCRETLTQLKHVYFTGSSFDFVQDLNDAAISTNFMSGGAFNDNNTIYFVYESDENIHTRPFFDDNGLLGAEQDVNVMSGNNITYFTVFDSNSASPNLIYSTTDEVATYMYYGEYSVLANVPPTIDVYKLDGYDDNASLPFFSGEKDGNLEITFYVTDLDQDDLTLDVYFSITQGAKSNEIIFDINLSTNAGFGSCDSNDSSAGMLCSIDVNISGFGDNNYFFDLEVNDGKVTDLNSSEFSVGIDNNVPDLNAFNFDSDWNNSDQNVFFECVDGYSGCEAIYYRVDGGDWQTYDANVLISSDGNHQIDFNAVDVAGNWTDLNTIYTAVDKSAPSTSDDHNAGWQAFDANVHLTCSDSYSGCSITKYRIDGGTWQTYDTNVLFDSDGNFQLDYNSTDVAGNIETTTSIWVAIDKSAPSTSWDGNHDTWQAFDANIHLTCDDNSLSGCSVTKYRLDTDSSSSVSYGSWQIYDTNILVSSDGNYAIDFNSTDVAGNVGDTNTFYVLIDKTAPNTVADYNTGWQIVDANVTFTCSDVGSGCVATRIRIDSDSSSSVSYGSWIVASNAVDLNAFFNTDGNYAVDFNSIDSVGNNESVDTIYVLIDKTAPSSVSVVVDSNAVFTSDSTPVLDLNAVDSVSDVNQMRFSCDGVSWSDYVVFSSSYSGFDIGSGAGCSGDGNVTVYVEFDNNAGLSAVATDAIGLDTNAPVADNNYLNAYSFGLGDTVLIYFSAHDDFSDTNVHTAVYTIEKPSGNDFNYSLEFVDNNNFSTSYSSLTQEGIYVIRNFYLEDNAGNLLNYETNLRFEVTGSGTGGDGGAGAGGGGGGGGGVAVIVEELVKELTFTPKQGLDNFFIYNCVLPFVCRLDVSKIDGKQEGVFRFKATKEAKKCEPGNNLFECKIKDDSVLELVFSYDDYSKFSEIVYTEVKVTDVDQKIAYYPVTVRVINLGYFLPLRIEIPANSIFANKLLFSVKENKIVGIRIWWIAIILIVLASLLIWHFWRASR